MTQTELEARRLALRSEIAVTRTALGVETARARENLKWVVLASAAMRLLPGKFKWVTAIAGAIAAAGALRGRRQKELKSRVRA